MVGFFLVVNINKNDLNLSIIDEDEKLVFNDTRHKDFYLSRNCNNKFLSDKLFYEDEEYLIVTDGVIFNSRNIIHDYSGENLAQSIINMYKAKGDEFYNLFRGSFSGVFYDKINNKWLSFTDHVGDKKVFYSKYKDVIIISSKIINIVRFFKANKIPYSFDKNGAYCLLTQGFMLQDYTLVKEIKKVLPGSYIKLYDDKVEVKKYHRYTNIPNYKQNEDEIIENIDRFFKNAVKRQFDKDREYNYKHIASLSGGLDSRMTTWVAHTLGYDDVLNYCFSQSNYYDEKISKHIATDLNNEYIFKTLDDAKFLFYLEEAVKINGGISIYYGMSHSKNLLDSLNLSNYGLVHTGQIGDVVLGTFLKGDNYNEKATKIAGAYSSKLKGKLDDIDVDLYDNLEMFLLYTRGFNGALSGNLAFQELTESYSPFYDVDFFEYCLSIPIKYRINHKIYFQWVKRKYPKAAKYYYEKLHGKISTPLFITKSRWFVVRCINKFLKTVGLNGLYGTFTKNGMNPFDYWYKNNSQLRKFINLQYSNNIQLLDIDQEIKESCIYLFNNGIMTEKFQVLTLLAAVKLLF